VDRGLEAAGRRDGEKQGEGTDMLAKFMQAKGHSEVVGMITSGGVTTSETR
jgi:hypothetical protein